MMLKASHVYSKTIKMATDTESLERYKQPNLLTGSFSSGKDQTTIFYPINITFEVIQKNIAPVRRIATTTASNN